MPKSDLVVSVQKYLAELHDRERRGEAARVVVRPLNGNRNQLSISVESGKPKVASSRPKAVAIP